MIGRVVDFLVEELQFSLILVDTCLVLLVKPLDDKIVVILEFLILVVFIVDDFFKLFEFFLIGDDFVLNKERFLLELSVDKVDMVLMFFFN